MISLNHSGGLIFLKERGEKETRDNILAFLESSP